MTRAFLSIALTLTLLTTARADMPTIVEASAHRVGMGWRIDVTLQHPDTGWEHYADGWEILDKSGKQLGYRKLMHPHVEEQPFTRSLVNVMLPDGTREVFIRANCSKAGMSTDSVAIDLRN
ncbi:hypothetical protein RXV86_18040 [Alisedimentitalea sp. MJ-SS2]|uniref:hypothetical protein n=1 Tax=Aliisedimentitalea sp. MJ-SS2 TaxID=3049795 RepID=UPI00290BF1F1|nr:hypothetical protein [Alisedimentitalea sp. MJ-SS2]MDU8929297.1 hypothetical protein [Alisedimentitalea sp. MJ-SS2]